MGLFDTVKSRLGFGNADDRGRDWQDQDYQEEYYDQGYDRGYDTNQDDIYGDYGDRSAGMRAFGVDRADYYNDNHSPLVTQSDVRSQQPRRGATEQPHDRIPVPVTRQRPPLQAARPNPQDDLLAFKGGLARTPNSFAQLHDERLRLEDSGKIVPLSSRMALSKESTGELYPVGSPSGYGYDRGVSAQARPQIHRRVEHIRPITYADAEEIAVELKKGSVVVLDLRTTRPDLAKRILDFAFGAASALEGQVERHIDRVYLFTSNGAVQDGERTAIRL